MSVLRSYHFIPAHREEYLRKAFGLRADALIFDLEDGVPQAQRPRAVENLTRLLADIGERANCFVRLAPDDTVLAGAQGVLVRDHPWLGIVAPKVGSPTDLTRLCTEKDRPLIPLIEDFHALNVIGDILASRPLKAIGLGLEDLLSALPFPRSEMLPLVSAIRSRVAIAAHAVGVQPIDSISLDLEGGISLLQDCRDARSCGFTGKFTIHPAQLDVVNECFSPSADDIARAERVTYVSNHSSGGYQKLDDGTLLSPAALRKAGTVMKHLRKSEEG